jgi:hypothetical protein
MFFGTTSAVTRRSDPALMNMTHGTPFVDLSLEKLLLPGQTHCGAIAAIAGTLVCFDTLYVFRLFASNLLQKEGFDRLVEQ